MVVQHNDLKRTGWDPNETQLTQANVSGGNFGKLFTRAVDDQTYSQPLIVNNVSVGGGIHNVVIVTTVNNSVYAYDADDAAASTPYWHVNLTYNPDGTNAYRPLLNTDMVGACQGVYVDFTQNIGIVGTPAIDTNTNTIYVVARSATKAVPTVYVQYLHALDLKTGADKLPPVYITATYPGIADDGDGAVVTFNQQTQNQRPALTLYQGVVYIAWSSHCDMDPYHGWVIGYDALTLAQKYVYNATPNGHRAGIWMSGQGLAVDDDGNFYFTTGNGTTGNEFTLDPNDPVNRGESLIKLSNTSGQLKMTDFFTPNDYQYLNDQDLDYGSDGVMLIPNTNLSLSGSKESYLYLIDNTNMGKTNSTNANVLQMLDINVKTWGTNHIHGTPVYFKDNNGKEYIYCWAEEGFLKQFPFDRSTLRFDTLNKKLGNTTLPGGMPGGILTISSNGSTPGTGIIWAVHPIQGNANHNVVPAIVQAFDATDVSRELWNSNMKALRDSVGRLAKFASMTVANGKLYVPTFSNYLVVYGLNPPPASQCPNPLPQPWTGADIGYTYVAGDECYDNGTFTLKASGEDIWFGNDGFHSVFQTVPGSNVDIIARVASVENTDFWAKAGVMFRANLDKGSPHAFMLVAPGAGPSLQHRSQQNDTSASITKNYGIVPPYWVKLTSDGNKYIGSISPDGNNWSVVDSVTVALGSHPYVGLAYTSHNNAVAGTAVFDNVTVVAHQDTLSVRLVDFTANNIDNEYTQLTWATGKEKNFDHFELERSGPNTNFQVIATVPGQGDSEFEQNYTYQDLNPMDGANHYRLKLVDKAGVFTYSNTLIVNFSLGVMELYPNPTTNGIVYLKNNAVFTDNKPLQVELLDQTGRKLMLQTYPTSGVSKITIQLPTGLAAGTYFVRGVNADGKKQIWKLQVRP